jgi:hypothetical protein
MAAALPLSASTIIFATGPQQVGGYEVNVKATFDFDYTAQTVTISLLNLESNPTDIAQTLGSVRFDIAGASGTPTYVSSSIGTFDIDNLGRPKSDYRPNSWSASNIGGNTIGFCGVCAAGGVGVPDLVIGGPDSNLRYSNDDGSLKYRNKPEPFIISSDDTYTSSALQSLDTSPSWVYRLSNMTPNVMVSNVFLGFGEGAAYGSASYFMPNYTEYDVPEPPSGILSIAGLGIAAGARRYLHSRS